MHPLFEEFFSLLRFSLGIAPRHSDPRRGEESSNVPKQPFSHVLTAEEWRWLHEQAKRQCLLGVLYKGIEKLPAGHRPPRDLLLRWSLEANQIAAMNTRMNETAARVTKLFDEKGVRSVILKGQANARLYPDPSSRQAGDIDILVEGGRKRVLTFLKEMNLMDSVEDDGHVHHVNLKTENLNNVSIEVHFASTYNYSPITDRKLQKFLSREIERENAAMLSPEGFWVPPITYALVMQLSHMFRHFMASGLGFRQLIDYYFLLCNCTDAERKVVGDQLKTIGLFHMAGAVMWIMEQVFCLNKKLMICQPDERRGLQLLEVVVEVGNFGKYSKENSLPFVQRWLADATQAFRKIGFDMSESLWYEKHFIINFIKSIPTRIRKGSLSLRK